MQINEQIHDNEVRLIGPDGEQLGIMSSSDALSVAISKDLDLVKIAPKAVPPVCKVINYGKYKFELAKKEKELKKNQKVYDLKEIRMSLSIDVHDFETKLKNAIKFLKSGSNVKVTVRFRGREMARTELGKELIDKFILGCEEYGTNEKEAKMEGRNMGVVLAPIGKSAKKVNKKD